MTAQDRIAKGYQPDFDIDYKVGYNGELFIARVLDSMKDGARFEVKNDQRAAGTGNFYLEYDCWKSGQWVASGVARKTDDTSELMSLVVADSVVVTAPRNLVAAVAKKYYRMGPAHRKPGGIGGSNPTHGVIVPIGSLVSELVSAAKSLSADSGWDV
jgi:hypothetical protein